MKTYEECAAAGMSKAETARHRGVTPAAVTRYAQKHGLKFRRAFDDTARVRQYRECAAKGMTQAETARELGVDPTAVCNMAKRAGIKFRDGKRRPFMGYPSIAAAARAMGKNYSTVWHYQPNKMRRAKK